VTRATSAPIAAVTNYWAMSLDQSLEISKVHSWPPFDAPPDIAGGHPVEDPPRAGLAIVDAMVCSQVVIVRPPQSRAERTPQAPIRGIAGTAHTGRP